MGGRGHEVGVTKLNVFKACLQNKFLNFNIDLGAITSSSVWKKEEMLKNRWEKSTTCTSSPVLLLLLLRRL